MKDIFKKVFSATKVSEVTDILEELGDSEKIGWKPVGGRKNNLATINLGSDPAAGLIERITNAIDAVFEHQWLKHDKPEDITSPRIASQEWFGIDNGKLSEIVDANEKSIKEAVDNVIVTYQESNSSERPTIEIRDLGIGIKSSMFSKTILSLQEDIKLKKLYLAGAFGQGGSTAISYSIYTLIISRPSPESLNSSDEDQLSFTIVRHNPKDYETDKHGVYEYLVNKRTGNPFSISEKNIVDDFHHGTLVRHISMEIGKYNGTITTPSRGLWYLAHHYLFDPVMPYWIADERDPDNYVRRKVTGNARLLSKTKYLEYTNEATRTFKSGSVRIKWWVLSTEGDDSQNRINHYTLRSKPIIITFNGQKQGELPNTIIKNDLNYPYLERYIIVQIDCDKLDGETRRNLFPTTRESIKDTLIKEDLRILVTETLEGDEQLSILNQDRRKRYLQRVDNASVENIRKRLARRVSASILAGGTGDTPRTLPPRGNEKNNDRPPIPIQEPPSFIDITNSEPISVYPGKRFTVKFKTDADPAYFSKPDNFIAILEPPIAGQYTGSTSIFEGYGTTYFKVSKDLSVGDSFNIVLEVRPRNHHSIRAEVKATVEEYPTTGKEQGTSGTPNINPQWVSKDDIFYDDENWNDRSVAKVVDNGDEISIFVSSENKLLNKLISRAQRKDNEAVDNIKDFYLEHISYYSVLSHFQYKKLIEDSDSEIDPELFEKRMDQEFMNACDSICGIADEMFELIIEE